MHRITQLQHQLTPPLVFSREVQEAIQQGRPLVALETTILTHGMPYPDNLTTALDVEDVVRAQGATPATIAIIDGVIHVGLTQDQLEHLAQAKDVVKCSRRDLATVLADEANGGTTVASTMLLASLVPQIKVFVTGGIGGVHRGVEKTWDISADLSELGRTPIAVVCAGIKSILDIPKTLEVLETQGVTVGAYRSTEFPAFFSPSSGCKAPYVFDSPQHAAMVIKRSMQLRLQSGMVIAVPIPREEFLQAGIDSQALEDATQQALMEMEQQGIAGREITPFLLQRINELTKGLSLQCSK